MKLYPSLISANLLNLQQVINTLEPWCDGFHIDIMDDHFVPNLTWGPMWVNAIRSATQLPLQVHLMVDKPQTWINRLQLNISDSFVFHYEAMNEQDILQLIRAIRMQNWHPGISINPNTSQAVLLPYLAEIDEVLIMSVDPGFSGQKFIESTIAKIEPLISYRSDNNLSFKICMDGGIDARTIPLLKTLGVDICAIASAIFKTEEPIEALKVLSNLGNAR